MIEVSLAEARGVAIASQRLHVLDAEPCSGRQVLDALGCIQLDTIHVVRRSHELVLLARGVRGEEAAGFLQSADAPDFFEYWAHAACIVPLRLWPAFGFRRRRFLDNGWRGPEVEPEAVAYVRSAVAEAGQVTITDLGGARGSGWEREAPAKWAAEWLLATGELACVNRRGWTRVYQDSSAVLPEGLLAQQLSDEECTAVLAQTALAALGIGTADDIADYFRLPRDLVQAFLRDADGIEQAAVEGWDEPAWALPSALVTPKLDEQACTPLSPFDSLVWHRPRTRRLFGVDYRLEAYVPAAKRLCGYFGMPVLAGSRIIGRIALRTSSGATRLEGHQLVDGEDTGSLHHAHQAAAAWAGACVAISEPQRETA